MPYSGADDSNLPQHVKDMPAEMRSAWVKAFNAAMAEYHDEGKAMMTANAMAKKMRMREGYAYAPGDDPDAWQLPLWESESGKASLKLLGRACAALSPGGLGGKRAVIPAEDLPFVKARIAAEYRALGAEVPVWARTEEAAQRVASAEVLELMEADAAHPNVWRIRAMRPGLNKAGTKKYTERALRESFPSAFGEVKMYSRHPANDSEWTNRAAEVGRDFVGVFRHRANESDGSPVGEATIIDDAFNAKLHRLKEANLMHQVGVSILAIGEGVKTKIGNSLVHVIERFLPSHRNSIDFVSCPGAGGEVLLEAGIPETDIDLVSEATLRERRPELVAIIESSATQQLRKELQRMDELTQLKSDLAAVQAKVAEAEKTIETLNAENQTLRADAAKAKVREAVAEALTNAGLPDDVTKDGSELHQQLAKVETVEAARLIIAEARIAQLTAKPTKPEPKVRNMGKTDLKAGDGKAALREAYIKREMRVRGLTREQAEAKCAE